jgi:formylglycine-generating enzyme required for sulfatase activity
MCYVFYFKTVKRGKKVRFGNGKNEANTSELNFDGSPVYQQAYSKKGEYRNKTVAVNTLSSNKLGLYHLSGNVLEWCSDFYGNYKKDAIKNPVGTQGTYRVLRGGSWRNSPQACRAAFGGYSSPTFRGYYLGFRIVSTL